MKSQSINNVHMSDGDDEEEEDDHQSSKSRKLSLKNRARLQKFKASFLSNKATNTETKAEDGEGDKEWHTYRLTFETSKDGMTRKDDPNDYVVVDPLLEKGKEKFNKMQAKLKKRDRESLT
ncbi:hypothetical protein QYE76_053471 [Lolium multiflorum]|uniref:Uncharacterized protein n=1 Tax=Lolium multiflorum TaxID=4521 RepID=A0AAD8SWW0_LOLMU|nr:hypothetical protein QYE76_053471 [Lolium multiflorum]